MQLVKWKNPSKPSPCPHSARSYGFNRFLERIRSWSPSNSALCCQECEKEMGNSSKTGAKFLWVCLDCDRIFCGTENLRQPGTHIHSHAVKNNHLFAIIIAARCLECKSTQQFMTMETNKELEINREFGPVIITNRQGDFANLPCDYIVRPLKNLGNTCFLNAILQNLLSISVLRDKFIRINCENRSVTYDLWILFLDTNEIEEEDLDLMSHADLLGSIHARAPNFRGHQEHDSHELLRELLSLMQNEGAGFIVQDVFGGQLSSTVTCVQCGYASKSNEPFLDLSLAIPSNECSTKNDEVGTPRDPVPSAMEISSPQEKCLSEETHIVPPDPENVDLSSQFSGVSPRKRPRLESQAQSGKNNGDPLSIEKCLDLFIAPEILSVERACDHCSNRSQDRPQTELQSTNVESGDKRVDTGSRMLVKPSDWIHCYGAILREVNDEPMTEVESKEEGVDAGSKEGGVDVGSKEEETKASKSYLILKAPPVLTIHLKRFTKDTNGIIEKINSHVNIQEELDLTPYMDPSCEDKEKPRYRLNGVVVHVGASSSSGHYVAYIRGVQSREHGLAWFRVSDEIVQQVSLKEVLDSEAYILFYERMKS